jgi:hypothetical protein
MTKLSRGAWALIIAAAVAGVSVGLAAAAVPRYVESRLAAALRADLRAGRVVVTVHAGPRDALAGRFDTLDLTIEQFRAGDLPVHRLHAELTGVELDRGRLMSAGELVLRRLGRGSATVTVTEAGLQEYLEADGTLRNARVRLADGQATVRGSIRVLTVDVTATMRGEFVILDGDLLAFRVRSISLGDLALPPEVGQSLSAAMNPLVRADEFPLPLRFTSVRTDRGEVVLRADAQP